jgi:hypothetical protein
VSGNAGTLESLFVTPVRPLELVLSKLAPYIIIGMIDLIICLLAAKFLFEVPIRGSLWIIIVSSLLYMMVSLSLGLFISAATRNQFAASPDGASRQLHACHDVVRICIRPSQRTCRYTGHQPASSRHAFHGLIKTLFMAAITGPTLSRIVPSLLFIQSF